MLSTEKQTSKKNNNILSVMLDNTSNLFEMKDNKKCIYCKKIVPEKSPRCIDCWLNNEMYYLLFEKIIKKEKQKFFDNFSKDLNSKKEKILKNVAFKCKCNLVCKSVIKNDKKFFICCQKKCNFFKYDPCNFLEDINTLILKINNIDYSDVIPEKFSFSDSQKIAIKKIYNLFFVFLEKLENKKRSNYDNFFRLDGFAGTGKSTIIQQLFDLPEFGYFTLCTCSNTHAAVEVSRNINHDHMKKFSKSELCLTEENDISMINNMINEDIITDDVLSYIIKNNSYETLSSLLNEKPKYNSNGTITFNDNTLQSIKREDKKSKSLYTVQKYDILIVDEYSMLTEDKVEWFDTFGKYLKTFIIFVGDKEQIPPQINIQNNSDFDTKLLTIGMEHISLIENYRTQGDVTQLANLIRESKNQKEIRNNINKFKNSDDISIISGPMNINNFDSIQKSFSIKSPFPHKLLAYSNNRIHKMNEIIPLSIRLLERVASGIPLFAQIKPVIILFPVLLVLVLLLSAHSLLNRLLIADIIHPGPQMLIHRTSPLYLLQHISTAYSYITLRRGRTRPQEDRHDSGEYSHFYGIIGCWIASITAHPRYLC